MGTAEISASLNFIEEIVEEDIKQGRLETGVQTRFPPEPNGYLHIGHAKSIVLNFGLAQKYGGKTNLRFDDTNPTTEDPEYVEAIMRDVQWLGYKWNGEVLYASDYFEQLYEYALFLIREGKAYVDFSTQEEIRAMRGVPTQPGTESPYRNTSAAENLVQFEKMTKGEYKEGECVLRAKIDMTSPNMHFRDPIMYRISFEPHYRTGTTWCIYPMYDWAHGQSDAIEGITHSVCTLEFEVHRPLYDWFLDQLPEFKPRPRQIEFARLNLSYTVMSKRKLLQLVNEKIVRGWDDPRMPTITGLRRRGYTPASIRNFATRIGIARRENVIDVSVLEYSIREDLNENAPRIMGVLEPLKMVILNYDEDRVEEMEIENNPEKPETGSRKVPFSRELYIEREDFMENPPKGFFRLGPNMMVRLKGAYIVRCDALKRDEETGNIIEIYCTYLPESRSGSDTSGIKVKGTIHWVSVAHALAVEVRLYDRLFLDEDPAGYKDRDFKEFLNPESLQILSECYVEPGIESAVVGESFQFIRKGYFCVDSDSTAEKLVFNRTVSLKDTWAKQQGN